jgi:hypothetical protein
MLIDKILVYSKGISLSGNTLLPLLLHFWNDCFKDAR